MLRYGPLIMDHFRNPRNVGELPDPDGVGLEENPVCGDTTQVWLRIRGGVVQEMRFKTRGCPAAIATSSICTERVTGMSLAQAQAISSQQVAGWAGGLPRAKVHCSVLVADALRKAIADYEQRAGSGASFERTV